MWLRLDVPFSVFIYILSTGVFILGRTAWSERSLKRPRRHWAMSSWYSKIVFKKVIKPGSKLL